MRRSRLRLAVVSIVLLLLCGVAAFSGVPGRTHVSMRGEEPVFADEFDGRSLDRTRWQTEMAWGPATDGQLERYDPSAIAVRDGQLVLTARKDRVGDRPYASGVVASVGHFEFQYGYAEIRARMPEGKGLWPAFWLAPVDDSSGSEIDIVELLGQEPDVVYMTLHFDGPAGHEEPQTSFAGPDFTAGYHTFGVDWGPDAVVWYVDGVERARQTRGVPHTPMYLIANLGVGGQWPGDPDGTTKFPAEYVIDYIRVYER